MSAIKVASRYAKALLARTKQEQNLWAVSQDMRLVARVLAQNPDLISALASPLLAKDKKKKILSQIFVGDSLSESVSNLFNLMIDKKRITLLALVASSFLALYRAKTGLVKASVMSACVLSELSETAIKDLACQLTGKQVLLEVQVKPHLIGGFILNIADKRLDVSVLGELKRIKQTWLST